MKSLDERFRAELEARPQVLEVLRKYALEAARADDGPIGMKAVAERARWEARITGRTDGFVINNSFVSRYARLLADQEPELRGRFAFRVLGGKPKRPDADVIVDADTGQTLFFV